MKVQQVNPAMKAAPEKKPDAPTAPEHVLELEDGRKIEMARPKVAINLRVYDMLGPDQSANGMLLLAYKALLHVRKINGEEVHAPQSNAEMLALNERLGDDGLDDVVAFYMDRFGGPAGSLRPLSTTPSAAASSVS